MTDNRNLQYEADLAEMARVVREYQTSDGHCEISVKVQHGFITLIEDTRKRKPEKVGG